MLRAKRRRTFNALEWPDRLNLGCGWDHRDGYLNVDLHAFHSPDLQADVTDLAMLPDGHYREIVAQDILEHITRTRTLDVLRRWSALLAPGGTLSLRVPSLLDLAALIGKPENQGRERQETLMQCMFGTQAYDGDYHLTSFTRPLLTEYLADAGLRVVEWRLRDEWLFEVTAEKHAS
jgi:predicted SAM-dependent methyltransferase